MNRLISAAQNKPLLSYVTGFVLSLALTLESYYLVVNHVFSTSLLIGSILLLAVVQLCVQLVFFLDLDKEARPRWNLVMLSFAVLVVLIIVLGSLWIMYHLDYSMNPTQTNTYILQDEGIQQ